MTMMLHYHIDNYICQSWSIDSNFDWFVVYYLGQRVNNNENRVIVITIPVSKEW